MDALARLGGTRIKTNIRRGDEEIFSAFGLIEGASVARKHCGQDAQKPIGVDVLYRKSDSQGHIDKFRHVLNNLADNDHLPDYALEYDQSKDQIVFLNRNTMPLDREKPAQDADLILLRLSADIGEKARRIVQGWNIEYVKTCFAAWWVKVGKPATENADALSLKFCRS